jgi:hypothetical protein
MMSLTLCPMDWRTACAFIGENHSHHKPPQGWKFGIGVNDAGRLCGVLTAGRPPARMSDDGLTLEVTRCCTDRTKHAASMLYGAVRKAAMALGYSRLITYTLEEECGTSLVAAGWVRIGPAGGGSWSRENRKRVDPNPTAPKVLWEAKF